MVDGLSTMGMLGTGGCRLPKATFLWPLLSVLFMISSGLFAQQSIVAYPEKNEMLLGEPLMLTISITGGQQYSAAVPDSLGHFEVLERLPATTSTRNGTVTTVQQVVITSFDSGALRIPPIAVEGNPSVSSPGVDVTVNTLPPGTKVEYGDIKQIIDPRPPSQFPYIIVFFLLAAVSGFMVYWLNRRRKTADVPVAPIEETESAGNLLQQMERVKQEWLAHQLTPLQLGNRMIEILRKYFASKGIHSRSKTGDEMIIATKNSFDPGTWQKLAQSIRLCNAMRFGKYQADETEGTESIEAFKEAIKNHQQRATFAPKPAVSPVSVNQPT